MSNNSLPSPPRGLSRDMQAFLDSIRQQVGILSGTVRSVATKVDSQKPLTVKDLTDRFPMLLRGQSVGPLDMFYEPGIYEPGVFTSEYRDIGPIGPMWLQEPTTITPIVFTDTGTP